MLLDHTWGFGLVNNDIFTCIGRIAFPIFAFMIVEGYFKTSNLKKYVGRLFIFALISEIPFNLMFGSRAFYPVAQNVLWTFLISIGLIWLMEKVKDKNIAIRALMLILVIILAFVLGTATLCDYHYAGVFMVLVFYFFRGKKWYFMLAQLICLYYINTEMLGGFEYVFTLFGQEVHLLRQSLSLIALIPIWLYNGKQGYYNKYIKYLYYSFYPCHIMLLWGLKQIVLMG
jgi:hypothetical protein